MPDAYGAKRYRDADGYVHALWTHEQWRSHRVYFIGPAQPRGQRGPVKVGFSTDVAQRLRQLQTASPIALEVLATAVGTFEMEALVHRWLHQWGCHVRGEWFEIGRDDIAEITVRLGEEGLVAP